MSTKDHVDNAIESAQIEIADREKARSNPGDPALVGVNETLRLMRDAEDRRSIAALSALSGANRDHENWQIECQLNRSRFAGGSW